MVGPWPNKPYVASNLDWAFAETRWPAESPTINLIGDRRPRQSLRTSDLAWFFLYFSTKCHTTRKFLNCQGSALSTLSGNSAPRPSSGVQSLYLPTTGPR